MENRFKTDYNGYVTTVEISTEKAAIPGRIIYDMLKAGKITLKKAMENTLYITTSDRNKKLIPNAKNNWMIWNIPAVITCPNATPHCIKYCYAKKAEIAYPSAKQKRLENWKISVDDNFTARMIYTIYVNLYKAEKNGKKLNIRIHESGDFYSRAYLEKWLEVAKEFENNNNVVLWCYTKSFSFFESEKEYQLLNIRASVWDDTKEKDIDIINRYNVPVYTAYTADKITDMKNNNVKFHLCRCADCSNCRACTNGKIKLIVCEIH